MSRRCSSRRCWTSPARRCWRRLPTRPPCRPRSRQPPRPVVEPWSLPVIWLPASGSAIGRSGHSQPGRASPVQRGARALAAARPAPWPPPPRIAPADVKERLGRPIAHYHRAQARLAAGPPAQVEPLELLHALAMARRPSTRRPIHASRGPAGAGVLAGGEHLHAPPRPRRRRAAFPAPHMRSSDLQ